MVIFHLLSVKLSVRESTVLSCQCFKFLILIMFIVGSIHCLLCFQNISIMIQLWNEVIVCTETRDSSEVGLDVREVNIYLGQIGDNPTIIKGFIGMKGALVRLVLGCGYC